MSTALLVTLGRHLPRVASMLKEARGKHPLILVSFYFYQPMGRGVAALQASCSFRQGGMPPHVTSPASRGVEFSGQFGLIYSSVLMVRKPCCFSQRMGNAWQGG